MNQLSRNISFLTAFIMIATTATVKADGIVAKIVNSPLSAAGLVQDVPAGINIYLQSAAAKGIEFMNPAVIGYGVPAGGRIEVELGDGFERITEVKLTQKAIMVVTGAPQQGMPGKAVGYKVGEGSRPNIISITPSKETGLPAESLMSPAKGAKEDPVRQRGIKVFHVGFLKSAFISRGTTATAHVRFLDAAGKVVHSGSASVDISTAPVPQIQPTNFPNRQRNHNWQTVQSGQTVGKSAGTIPLPIMLYARATGKSAKALAKFKQGIVGVGVLSTPQLAKMKYQKPTALARYNGGLIIRDKNNDGVLDPKKDQIIGGILAKAPAGAKGQELRSLNIHGAADLSRPTTAFSRKAGKRFGGAIGLLQFTAGNKPGLYRPTLALLSDPADQNSGDGSSYTYTIVVK